MYKMAGTIFSFLLVKLVEFDIISLLFCIYIFVYTLKIKFKEKISIIKIYIERHPK